MPLLTKTGTFTAAATGNQVVSGVGFQPKALLIWGVGAGSEGAFGSHVIQGLGFSTSPTNQFAQSSITVLNSDTSLFRRMDSCAFLQTSNGASAFIRRADLVSMNADGFTLNWTTASSSFGVLHYLALGGDDLTGAKVVNWQTPTVTGLKAVTGVGFQPDIAIHVHAGGVTTLNVNATTGAAMGVGAMTATGQWATGYVTTSTSAHARNQEADKALTVIDTAGAILNQAQYASMDADGFSLNFGISAATAYQAISLCLKGGSYNLGQVIKSMASAPVAQSVTGLGYQPTGLMLAGVQDISRTEPYGFGAAYGMGATDGTSQWGTALYNATAAARTNISKSTKGYIKRGNDTSAIDAEADLTLDAAGFSINWTTNDTAPTAIPYIAFGGMVTATPHPLDAVDVGSSADTATRIRASHAIAATESGVSADSATRITTAHAITSTDAGTSQDSVTRLSTSHAIAASDAGTSADSVNRLTTAHVITAADVGISTDAALALTIGHALTATDDATSADTVQRVRLSQAMIAAESGASSDTVPRIRLSHAMTAMDAGQSSDTALRLLTGGTLAGLDAGTSADAAAVLNIGHLWEFEEGTTNYVTNPSAETDTTMYAPIKSVLARDTLEAFVGSASVKVVTNGTASYEGVWVITPAGMDLSAVTVITSSVHLKGSGTVFVWTRLLYTDGTSQEGTYAPIITLNSEWTRYVAPNVPVASGKTINRVQCFVRTNSVQLTTFWIDAVQIEEKASATAYTDGSLGEGYTWTGTPHASISTRAMKAALDAGSSTDNAGVLSISHVWTFEEAVTNLLPNPVFYTDLFGWNRYGFEPVSRDPNVRDGVGASIRMDRGTATGFAGVTRNTRDPIVAGSAYTFSGKMQQNQAVSMPTRVRWDWYDSAGVRVTVVDTSLTIPPGTTWTDVVATETAPAGAATMGIVVYTPSGPVGETFWLTRTQLEQKSYATDPIPEIDAAGNLLPGYTWTGTSHASTSTRAGRSAAPDAGLSSDVVTRIRMLHAMAVRDVGISSDTALRAFVGHALRVLDAGRSVDTVLRIRLAVALSAVDAGRSSDVVTRIRLRHLLNAIDAGSSTDTATRISSPPPPSVPASTLPVLTLTVRINGIVTPVRALRTSHGVDQPIATGSITIAAPKPVHAEMGSPVTIHAGYNGAALPIFTGRIPQYRGAFSASGGEVTIDLEGLSRRLYYGHDTWLGVQGPISFFSWWRSVCAYVGIANYWADATEDVDGFTLMLGANDAIHNGLVLIDSARSPGSEMARLARLWGYRHFDTPTHARLMRISGLPTKPVEQLVKFEQGVNVREIRRDESLDGIANYWDVYGAEYTATDGSEVALRSFPAVIQTNPLFGPSGIAREELRDEALDTWDLADAARNAHEQDYTEPSSTWSWEARGDPEREPGEQIALLSQSVGPQIEVLGTTISFPVAAWLMRVEHDISERGWTTSMTGWSGAGTALPAGNDCTTISLLGEQGVHLGDEYLSYYRNPSPNGNTGGIEHRIAFTVPDVYTTLTIRGLAHGTNSYLTATETNVSRFEIWQGGERATDQGDLPFLPEYVEPFGDGRVRLEDGTYSTNRNYFWYKLVIPLSGSLNAGAAELRIISGSDTGYDDFEVCNLSINLCGVGQPLIINPYTETQL